MPPPCKVPWCGALAAVASEYCVIHEKYPKLRMESADRSWRTQRAHEAAKRREAAKRARREADEAARLGQKSGR